MINSQFIATDTDELAIYGLGKTADAAIANARRESNEPNASFIAKPATQALLAQVEEEGGCIAWGDWDGIACTVEEDDKAQRRNC